MITASITVRRLTATVARSTRLLKGARAWLVASCVLAVEKCQMSFKAAASLFGSGQLTAGVSVESKTGSASAQSASLEVASSSLAKVAPNLEASTSVSLSARESAKNGASITGFGNVATQIIHTGPFILGTSQGYALSTSQGYVVGWDIRTLTGRVAPALAAVVRLASQAIVSAAAKIGASIRQQLSSESALEAGTSSEAKTQFAESATSSLSAHLSDSAKAASATFASATLRFRVIQTGPLTLGTSQGYMLTTSQGYAVGYEIRTA